MLSEARFVFTYDYFVHSALRRISSSLWTQSSNLGIGLIKPQSALKLERQMQCALPPPQSKDHRLPKIKLLVNLHSFVQAKVSLVSVCSGTDGHLLEWSC